MGRRLASGLALTVALTVAALADGIDLEKLVAELGENDSSRRVAALNQLRGAKDERAIPLLLSAVDRFELYGRYYAVLVLESYPERTAETAFRRLLQKDDPFLRLCAGAWFLRRGNPAHVDAIVEALAAEGVDVNTRVYMVNRLYSLSEPRVRAALHALLDAEAPTTLLGSVLQALQHPEDEATKAAVRDFLETKARAADARLLAAAFLYRFGDETRKTEIADALRSGETSSTAFYRLKSFLTSAGHAATEILDAAAALLKTETNSSVLRAIVDLLAEYGHRGALASIEKLVGHADASLAKAAFEAVAVLGGGIEVDALRALLDADDPDQRLAAADLLRRMDDLSGLDAVVEVLRRSGDATERREAARVLGAFRRRAAVEPLLDALLDEDTGVRSAAHYALDPLLRHLFPYRRLDFVATGYTANAPAAQRRDAARRIRAWWDARKDGDW